MEGASPDLAASGGGAGRAIGHQRDPARDLALARRRPAGVRGHRRQRGPAVRRRVQRGRPLRGRTAPSGCGQQHVAGGDGGVS